jgi:enolase
MSSITSLRALEILDSRGRPTVQVTCELASGALATASVPSGASTGQAEALELRDGDTKRYGGLGCQKAVRAVETEIFSSLGGKDFGQSSLDHHLLRLDGTPNKIRLGANAVLAVSLAFARAQSLEQGVPLYQHYAALVRTRLEFLPRLTVNLFSGGKHAGGQVVIQDVLLVPQASTVAVSLEMTYAVVQSAKDLVKTKYNARPLKADEGGLAPAFANEEAMLEDAVTAVERAGLKAGEDVALALDVASSHFYQDGVYKLGERTVTGDELIDILTCWRKTYPILSLEDPLAEEDWESWTTLNHKLGQNTCIVGDDLLCTNPERIRKAVNHQAANSLLLKVNQIGTLTEAAEALRLARANGWQVVVSARSGETEDTWLADLAVGWQGDYLKVGSIQQSERLAKYNRLLAVEAETGLPLRTPPERSR